MFHFPDNEPQTIKIEVIDRPPGSDDDNQESITDIQNYLQSFNKEIQTVQGESAESNSTTKFNLWICSCTCFTIFLYSSTDDGAATDVNNSETNTIYVTESGEYFYQADAVSGQVVTVVNSKLFLKLSINSKNYFSPQYAGNSNAFDIFLNSFLCLFYSRIIL